MSASMSGVPAIALSYGIFQRPPPEGTVNKANKIACTVIGKLCESLVTELRGPSDDACIQGPRSILSRKRLQTCIM